MASGIVKPSNLVEDVYEILLKEEEERQRAEPEVEIVDQNPERRRYAAYDGEAAGWLQAALYWAREQRLKRLIPGVPPPPPPLDFTVDTILIFADTTLVTADRDAVPDPDSTADTTLLTSDTTVDTADKGY
jgi:hypothetical protein